MICQEKTEVSPQNEDPGVAEQKKKNDYTLTDAQTSQYPIGGIDVPAISMVVSTTGKTKRGEVL